MALGRHGMGRKIITRRFAAFLPVLLVLGILAQLFLLIAVIVLYIPSLIRPSIYDGFSRWITKGFARVMIRGSISGKRKSEVLTPELPFCDGHAGVGASVPVCPSWCRLTLAAIRQRKTGGTK
jgi:hypothetical protein